MYRLEDLAARLDLPFRGDPSTEITGLASLGLAGPQHLSFLAGKQHYAALAVTSAAAVILQPEYADDCPVGCLLADQPYLVYARASQLFEQRPAAVPGVHVSAVVASSVVLGEGVSIGPMACIEDGVVLGAGTEVGAGVFIGANTRIGARCRLYPNTVLYHGVTLGDDCTVHSQTVIGSDGFGFAPNDGAWEKIYQLGAVSIGNGVEIGGGCTIDRGALEDTVIDDGVIIDNQVHIAHNCRIGKNTAIAGCVGIAGSTTIGANCMLAGQVGVSGHLSICDNVHLTGQARVTKSITEPGSYSSGTPTATTRDWGRMAVRFTQLESLHKRLSALEAAQNDNNN